MPADVSVTGMDMSSNDMKDGIGAMIVRTGRIIWTGRNVRTVTTIAEHTEMTVGMIEENTEMIEEDTKITGEMIEENSTMIGGMTERTIDDLRTTCTVTPTT